MSGHTPGPWHVPHFAINDIKCNCGYVFSDHQGHMGAIAEICFATDEHPENCHFDEAVSNARLIAAAPDMLDALRKANNFISNTESEHNVVLDSGKAVRAAIARATGEK